MLQAWLSVGYIVLLAILVLAFILWRRGVPVLAIAALVVGIPLWFGWEYVRPTWTTGVVTGTEVRRSDPDARGNTSDIQYIYMRNRSDRGLELINEDSWWWLKRNSDPERARRLQGSAGAAPRPRQHQLGHRVLTDGRERAPVTLRHRHRLDEPALHDMFG